MGLRLNPHNRALFGACGVARRGPAADACRAVRPAGSERQGLSVIDARDPTNPVLIGQYDTPGMAYEVAWHNDTAYVADSGVGLQIIDVAAPSFTQPMRSFGSAQDGRDIVARNGRALLVDAKFGGSGLVAYDVSNPQTPAVLGSYGAGTSNFNTPNAVALQGHHAITAGDDGLQILDVTDPAAISLTGEYKAGEFNAIAVSGNYAYVGLENGLWTFDITDKASPSVSDRDTLSLLCYTIESIAIDDAVLHATSPAGLVSAGLEDPANPAFYNSATTEIAGTFRDVSVVADRLVLSQDSATALPAIGLFDSTNLPSVSKIGAFEFSALGLESVGRHLYASEYFNQIPSPSGSLLILDMADPANPSLAGTFALPDTGRFLDAADDYIFVATKTNGLAMMQREPTLLTSHVQSTVGSVLDYAVSWAEFPASVDLKASCAVTGGECTVTSVDQENRQATLTWRLPLIAGDYELAVAVGDQHSFFSTRDRVQAQ